MKSPLTKYPFKKIKQILETIVQHTEGCSIEIIVEHANTCTPDSIEIADMLCYITSYGKVNQTENLWQIYFYNYTIRRDYHIRKYFLDDVERII